MRNLRNKKYCRMNIIPPHPVMIVMIWQVHLYSVLPDSDVWHSGIVAYGREYFFTSRGVVSVMPVRRMNNLSGMSGNELSSDPANCRGISLVCP